MPARRQWRGAKHPVTIVMEEIESIFRDLGFTIATGPEAEHEWYNFGALNFPPDHPAMDMHDTLYLEHGGLLRTHTSPVQIRTLQSYPPPIRILAPGNVFRRDFFDASHAPMFAPVQGLAVDGVGDRGVVAQGEGVRIFRQALGARIGDEARRAPRIRDNRTEFAQRLVSGRRDHVDAFDDFA